ncbi:MAG: ABC transporter substrate-binding protein [Immundisolibacteraceae bacterium]|nr:ABC transporter substrate-binding protein [Immundisolibacteraceae bacterium]
MERTIYYTRCPVATATGIALETGQFEKEFTDGPVQFLNIKTLGRDKMLKSHFDHHLDNSVREGGAIPPIWARSRGADTVLLGLTFVKDSLAFMVRADSDIHSFRDLADKRCSLPLHPKLLTDFMRANTERGFLSAMAEHDMAPESVNFVDTIIDNDFKDAANPDSGADKTKGGKQFEATMFDHELTALLADEVDVIFTKNVQPARLMRLHGDKLRIIYDLLDAKTPDHIINGNPRIITISRNVVDEDPELVIRYLQVLIRSAHYGSSHQAETARIWAGEIGVEVEDIYNSYRGEFHTTVWPSLSDTTLRRLRVQIDFLCAKGYLENDVDIDQWMATDLLKAAYRRENLSHAA